MYTSKEFKRMRHKCFQIAEKVSRREDMIERVLCVICSVCQAMI